MFVCLHAFCLFIFNLLLDIPFRGTFSCSLSCGLARFCHNTQTTICNSLWKMRVPRAVDSIKAHISLAVYMNYARLYECRFYFKYLSPSTKHFYLSHEIADQHIIRNYTHQWHILEKLTRKKAATQYIERKKKQLQPTKWKLISKPKRWRMEKAKRIKKLSTQCL